MHVARGTERPERLGVLAAGHLTNEDGYAIRHFAEAVIGTGNVDNFGRSVDGPTIWGLQQATGQHYRRPSLSELVDYDVIICLSSNIGDLNAQAGSWLAHAQQVGARLVVLDQLDDGLGRAGDMYLEHAPGALAALLAALGDAVEADVHGVECPVDVTVLGDERFAEGFRRLVATLGTAGRVAIVLSTLVAMAHVACPHDAVLGDLPGLDGWVDIDAYRQAVTEPGLLVYRFDAPLFFVNADRFCDRVEEVLADNAGDEEWLVLDFEGVGALDSTAADALAGLLVRLRATGIIHVGVARANHEVLGLLGRAELLAPVGPIVVYPTINAAVRAYRQRT